MADVSESFSRTNRVQSKLYEQVRSSLMRQKFVPGEHLRIGDLASQFGVSATPMREVLGRLSKEGLVHSVYGKGFFCPAPDLKSLHEIVDAVHMILAHSLRSISAASSKKELSLFFVRVYSEAEALRTENGSVTVADGRVDFEEQTLCALIEFSGNDAIARIFEGLLMQSRSIRLERMQDPEDFQVFITAIQQIESALVSGDAGMITAVIAESKRRQSEQLPSHIISLVSRCYLGSLPLQVAGQRPRKA